MRGAIEWSNGNARDPLHHETIIEDGTERFQGWRWRGQKTLGILGPELVHDDAMGHVHEAEADGGFVKLCFAWLRPAHGFQKGQREGGSDSFQARATVDEASTSDWTHRIIIPLVAGFVDGNTWLEIQPMFERGFHFPADASVKLSGSFADELGELHRLDALDVDITLLSQPRHAGQCDLVRCVLKLRGDQYHAGQSQPGIGFSRQNERIARFTNHAQVDEPNFARLRDRSHP